MSPRDNPRFRFMTWDRTGTKRFSIAVIKKNVINFNISDCIRRRMRMENDIICNSVIGVLYLY